MDSNMFKKTIADLGYSVKEVSQERIVLQKELDVSIAYVVFNTKDKYITKMITPHKPIKNLSDINKICDDFMSVYKDTIHFANLSQYENIV